MRTTTELQKEIVKLKQERDICILAHTYQTQDILEIADFTGDSFALSKFATSASQKTILMCGVRFMAETVKILSPDKKVILSHSGAGCPMAEQMTANELRRLKSENPDHAVVAYINTTAELKCECDVCVTSASALEVVSALPQKNILFIPDCNLGSWLEGQLPEKSFKFIDGGCPVHMRITATDVVAAKKSHPDALILVHPECKREVTELADYVGSTTGIMSFAEKSECQKFIIGTETNVVTHLQFSCPDKEFFPLSKHCICTDMRLTTLVDVLDCIERKSGEEITLCEGLIKKARTSIDRMLR